MCLHSRFSLPPVAQSRSDRQVYYKGIVPVNLIGIWKRGFAKPLWIMTSMEPEQGLAIYQKRMKIEASFRDLKSLLHVDKIMNKSRAYLENMLALVLITYAIGFLIGEAIRDVRYAGVPPDAVDLHTVPDHPASTKWHSFSGLFILLMRRRRLDCNTLSQIVMSVIQIFTDLVLGKYVRSFVST